jgi:hypothetical protein
VITHGFLLRRTVCTYQTPTNTTAVLHRKLLLRRTFCTYLNNAFVMLAYCRPWSLNMGSLPLDKSGAMWYQTGVISCSFKSGDLQQCHLNHLHCCRNPSAMLVTMMTMTTTMASRVGDANGHVFPYSALGFMTRIFKSSRGSLRKADLRACLHA